MTTTTNSPVPGSGPDATLNLSDPSTWILILSTVGAIATRVVPSLAGWHLDGFYSAIALLAAAIVAGFVLYSKHHLAAALAVVGSATVHSTVGVLETTGSALPPDLLPRLDALEHAVGNLPQLQTDQVKAVLAQLFGGPPAPAPAVQIVTPGVIAAAPATV